MTFLPHYLDDPILAPEFGLFADHVSVKQEIWSNALVAAELDAVLVAGGSPKTRFFDDLHFPFKPAFFFAEWLPIEKRAGYYLLVFADERRRTIFHPTGEDIWHSTFPAVDERIAAHFDWVGYDDLSDIARNDLTAKAAFLGDPDFLPDGLDTQINPDALIRRLDWHRAFKSEWEVSCLLKANALGSKAHRAVRDAFFEREVSEYDLHLEFLKALQAEQGELPYDTIIALNQNGSTLHHFALEKRAPTEIRSLLIDAGADYLGYGSDISRTYTRSTGPFADLLKEFDRLQQDLVSKLRPGLQALDFQAVTQATIADLLVHSGISTMSRDALLETGQLITFFPHSFGHMLGLQVHDRGGTTINPEGQVHKLEYAPMRLTRQLEAGQVITIEPGLYFVPSQLEKLRASTDAHLFDWGLIEELVPYGGMRIEDNVLLRDEGPLNLTRVHMEESF